jgi:hypothetical protein
MPLVWILRAIWLEVDPVFVWRLFSIDSFGAITILAREYRLICQAFGEVINLAIFIFLVSWLVRNQSSRIHEKVQSFIFSLYSFFAFVSIVKYFNLIPGLFESSWNFWMGINRFGGVFTDPNALGLCASLCALWYIDRFRKNNWFVSLCFSTLWIFLGIVSGSRTFFLIIGSASFIYCIKYFFLHYSFDFKKQWMKCCLLVLLVVSLPTIVHTVAKNAPGIGLTRLSKLLDPESFNNELSSRYIFFRVNYFLFKEAPLFGVGFNQFDRKFAHASEQLNLNTQRWKDNPNSFYLGIFSELGLIGVLVFLIGLAQIKFRPFSDLTFLSAGGYAFLISLIVGCHLDFIEVAILAPFLVEKSIIQIHSLPLRFKYLNFVLIMISIFYLFSLPKSENGYFRKKDSIYVRRKAFIAVECARDITIESPLMNTSKTPFVVRINEKLHTVVDSSPFLYSTAPCTSSEKFTYIEIWCSRFFLVDRPYCVRLK